VVLEELGNIPLWGVDLGPCVGFFSGSWAIFLYEELIWGTVQVVFGGFGGVNQFFFMES
jgi:hypothetical protein